MINKLKRIGSVLIMLLLFVTTLSIQVMAATGTVNGLSIATSGSTGKITIGTNSATLTVEKSWSVGGGTAEDTFRFTNPSTNTRDLKISFDYSFEGTSKSISGVTEDTGSKCAVTLNPGGSFSVSVKATAGKFSSAKSTFSITNLSVVEVIDSAQVTVAVDNGIYGNFVKDKAGYGLAQWTYYTRKRALFDYAKKTGTSIGSLDMQLAFLWDELQGYKTVINTLKSAGSVRAASDAVLLIVLGIINGGMADVLNKAVKICTECIGLG